MTAARVRLVALIAAGGITVVVAALAGLWIASEPEDAGFIAGAMAVVWLVLVAIVGGIGAIVWAILGSREHNITTR